MRAQRTLRSKRGYTVVEVLAAMTLFAIGAAGVISMQRVTVQGGADARRFDVATNIAQQWAARLQRDAMFWTLPSPSNPSGQNIENTLWIKDAMSGGTPILAEGLWHAPAIPTTPPTGATGTTASPANDLFGHEVAPGSDDRIFCVQIRESWIVPPPSIGAFLRAEVRVVWARLDSALIDPCDSAALPAAVDADPNRYHFVYVTTAIRENTGQ